MTEQEYADAQKRIEELSAELSKLKEETKKYSFEHLHQLAASFLSQLVNPKGQIKVLSMERITPSRTPQGSITLSEFRPHQLVITYVEE